MRRQAQEPPVCFPRPMVVFLAVLLPFRHAFAKRFDQRQVAPARLMPASQSHFDEIVIKARCNVKGRSPSQMMFCSRNRQRGGF